MAAEWNDWFEATPRCARHSAEAAVLTCARCGAFCCDGCRAEAWCEPCALMVKREHLPATARAIAWKLLLGPAFLLGSAGLYATRGEALPRAWLAWLIPVVCAVVVLRRFSPVAAWLGAGSSLLLLGWQAFTLFVDGAELRLLDVGLLAIAPTLALDGALKLGRLFASVRVQDQMQRALAPSETTRP